MKTPQDHRFLTVAPATADEGSVGESVTESITQSVTPSRTRILDASRRERSEAKGERSDPDERERSDTEGALCAPEVKRSDRDASGAIRSGGAPSERSERRRLQRGPSARRLAEALRRKLVAEQLQPDSSLRAYSLSLTTRTGERRDVLRMMLDYADTLEHRLTSGGAIMVLDRAPETGRWHCHALLVAPAHHPSQKFLRWWVRLEADRKHRPSPHGQHATPLASPCSFDLDKDLSRTLTHHFIRRRKGASVDGLPPLNERVVSCGSLVPVWSDVAARLGVWGVTPSDGAQRQPDPKKASTKPSRRKAINAQTQCSWCGASLLSRRADATWCSRDHRCAGSRALRRAEEAHGPELRKRVLRLEATGWLRRDAIRVMRSAIFHALDDDEIRLAKPALRCSCGRAIAARANAKTCGRSACRMRRHRKRRS